jgi:excisionase family DNA binding protein
MPPRTTPGKKHRNRAMQELPPGTPTLMTIVQIASALNTSREKVEQMIKDGEFPQPDKARWGGKRVWRWATYCDWYEHTFPAAENDPGG